MKEIVDGLPMVGDRGFGGPLFLLDKFEWDLGALNDVVDGLT